MPTTRARKPRPGRLLDGFPPDTRIVAAGVTWEDYENLVNQVGKARNFRIAFDGMNIEMMTLGPFHERQKSRLDLFIAFVAGELKVRSQPMGSTTWRRKKLKRAIESDLCYYFEPAKLAAVAAAADSDNIDDFPNPDLVVEVDVSPPKIDRSGIYAALRCRNSGGREKSRYRLSNSALMGSMCRFRRAGSCACGPRTSRGGSSTRMRTTW